jgi:integrase
MPDTNFTKGRARRVTIDLGVVRRALADRDFGRNVIADAVCPGLRLVVGARAAAWYYAYRPRGLRPDGSRFPGRQIRLGSVTDLSPAQARQAVETAQERIAAGGDPAAEQRAARTRASADRAARRTVEQMVDAYAKVIGPHHPDIGNVRRTTRDARLGCLWADDLTAEHLNSVVDELASKPATARARAGAMKRMSKWAKGRAIIPSDPFTEVTLPKPPPPRRGRPSASDVRALWNSDLTELDLVFIRSALLLPLRAGELSELRAEHVDLRRRSVELPGTMTKNGREFSMPLSVAAFEILSGRITQSGGGRLFQLNSAGGPMNAWTGFYRRVRKIVPGFRLHDLRRLFPSVLAEQGIGDSDLTDGLLNHAASETRGGVRAHYHQADLRPAQARVMERWALLVAHAVEYGEWPDLQRAEVVQIHEARR